MRKKYIFIPILLIIIAIPSISLLSVKKDLEETRYSSLLDIDGEEIVNAEFHKFSKGEIPDTLSKYYFINIDSHIDKLLFSDNFFKRTLYNLFLKERYTEKEKLLIIVNHLYFDNGISGLSNSAEYYFNKKVDQLTTLEQIFLLYKTKNKETMNIEEDILTFMDHLVQLGIIQSDEKFQAKKEFNHLVSTLANENTVAQSYTQLVIKELVKELNMTEEEIFRRGFEIQTTLDKNVQLNLYNVFHNNELFPVHNSTFIESGMAIMDYETGRVSGIMGGRNYVTNTYNHAIDTKRQPASTFKPLMVYGPAIELGWKPNDKLKDTPMALGMFTPRNYDYKYRGEVTLLESLSMSYNVPTAWLLSEIGLQTGLDYIDKFGLFTVNQEEGYKLALGYTSVGTSPLALTEAYSVFPNEGKLIKAKTVESIKDKSGKVIYETDTSEKTVFTAKTAKVVSSMLEEVISGGTGKEAQVPGQSIAGKTGTTSYDGWFVGFNDKYIGTVWIGPDEVIPENRMQIDGGGYPATIFREVFKELKK